MLFKSIRSRLTLCSLGELHAQGFSKHNSSKWNGGLFFFFFSAFLILFAADERFAVQTH